MRIFKKLHRYFSRILFYILILLLAISVAIEPTIPVTFQDGIIVILSFALFHFLNERKILFKNIEIFAKDIEKNKIIEKEKEAFVANITHDLKTPTLAQMTTLNILLKESLGTLNDGQKNLLKQILSSCSYMSDMINTILYTYKYEEGNVVLNLEEFDFKCLVYKICSDYSNLASERGQDIIFNAQGDIILCADKLQMTRVVTNLIANAINHGAQGKNISVFVEQKNNNLFFIVENEGATISKDKIKIIFDKYVTCRNQKIGHGLGLYLSKKIIEKHNGNIFAKSENGLNSFGFEMPSNVVKLDYVRQI
ncbi:MAG: HAMP domain-containing histidine kinase [Cyanobacteria bacterium SIG30]|nr:HAMP domain-containing histidine kinase [Cyanobacteria bacterium SIG30]